MNEKRAMEIVEDTELSTAQWTALRWYFKQKQMQQRRETHDTRRPQENATPCHVR